MPGYRRWSAAISAARESVRAQMFYVGPLRAVQFRMPERNRDIACSRVQAWSSITGPRDCSNPVDTEICSDVGMSWLTTKDFQLARRCDLLVRGSRCADLRTHMKRYVKALQDPVPGS
jgi:hypothetical protein